MLTCLSPLLLQYMTWPATVTDQPPKSLRGFEKATLVPGETRTFDFRLKAKDLAVYDANRATWTIPAGEYTFAVGPDSRTLPISVSLQVRPQLASPVTARCNSGRC